MTNREKQRDLFIELINYQLKDHGVTYDDVKENPMWYMEYKTTPEKEDAFINHCLAALERFLNYLKLLLKKRQAGLSYNGDLQLNRQNRNQPK